MKIALIGYGKMGKAIEKLMAEKFPDMNVQLRISSANAQDLNISNLKQCDVAIEFSKPDLAEGHVRMCMEAGIPVVCGTTGWYEQLNAVKSECEAGKGTLMYGTNFSMGVNMVFEINRMLAKLMNGKEYIAGIEEIHHTQKLDKPSGTAVSLASQIIAENKAYKDWALDDHIPKAGPHLPIIAKREEDVPGTHIVRYTSFCDSIEIRHEALNRQGFAEGAIVAARWLIGKKGYFTMSDLIAQT